MGISKRPSPRIENDFFRRHLQAIIKKNQKKELKLECNPRVRAEEKRYRCPTINFLSVQ
jgi:hypothetical protein